MGLQQNRLIAWRLSRSFTGAPYFSIGKYSGRECANFKIRCRTEACKILTRIVEVWPSPPGWIDSRELVIWINQVNVSMTLESRFLIAKPPVRANTSAIPGDA